MPEGGAARAAERLGAATLLFDLDGTLIDSVELIRRCWRHTLDSFGLEGVPDSAFLSQMGRPLESVMELVAGGARRVAEMAACYRAFQVERHDDFLALYDGVLTMVEALVQRGTTLAVVTSKPCGAARRGLEFAGLAPYFELVIGAESVQRHKPDPAPVLAALHALGAAPQEAAMIGDSPFDVRAGAAAGTRTAACLWGPFTREAFADCRPDVFLAEPLELLEHFG